PIAAATIRQLATPTGCHANVPGHNTKAGTPRSAEMPRGIDPAAPCYGLSSLLLGAKPHPESLQPLGSAYAADMPPMTAKATKSAMMSVFMAEMPVMREGCAGNPAALVSAVSPYAPTRKSLSVLRIGECDAHHTSRNFFCRSAVPCAGAANAACFLKEMAGSSPAIFE
ncbi:MAG: hypothetical protein AB7H71_15160, partial [Alphaproteobacteria bacterium]